jgi:hypothetical protein
MDQFLKSLRHRRPTAHARIEDEQARPAPDQMRLSALKSSDSDSATRSSSSNG